MGSNNEGYALISMGNKDVYYVDKVTAKEIIDRLSFGTEDPGFVKTTDIKSGAEIVIAVSHISSVVVKG